MFAHAHIAPMIDDERFNYSHRINKFSFGSYTSGLVQPLEGDEVITDKGNYNLLFFARWELTQVLNEGFKHRCHVVSVFYHGCSNRN